MKSITIPQNKEALSIIKEAIKTLQDSADTSTRHKKPYDQVLILKVVNKAIGKALRSTGN